MYVKYFNIYSEECVILRLWYARAVIESSIVYTCMKKQMPHTWGRNITRIPERVRQVQSRTNGINTRLFCFIFKLSRKTRSSYGHSYVWRGHTTAPVTHPNPASFVWVSKNKTSGFFNLFIKPSSYSWKYITASASIHWELCLYIQ